MVFLAIMDTRPSGNTILIEGEQYRFQPVVVLEEKIGYMVIWHERTKTAVHLSRFRIPPYLVSINSTDNIDESIPSDLSYQPFKS